MTTETQEQAWTKEPLHVDDRDPSLIYTESGELQAYLWGDNEFAKHIVALHNEYLNTLYLAAAIEAAREALKKAEQAIAGRYANIVEENGLRVDEGSFYNKYEARDVAAKKYVRGLIDHALALLKEQG